MRLISWLIIILAFNETYSQDLKQSLDSLIYRHGCHGYCDFSYCDTCGVFKDSIIEIVKIVKVQGDILHNENLISRQKADSLNTFLAFNFEIIKKLVDSAVDEEKAKFVPPDPICYEFEEYTIVYKASRIHFILLDHNKNEIGTYLRDFETEIFRELNKIIK